MKNILIIDDEMHIRTALARELRAAHYNILRAETGIEALTKMEKQSVDFVITDIRMPVMGGVDFIKRVTADFPTIKLIILSGSVTKDVIQEIQPYRKHIVDVLAKPWDSEKLMQLLEQSV